MPDPRVDIFPGQAPAPTAEETFGTGEASFPVSPSPCGGAPAAPSGGFQPPPDPMDQAMGLYHKQQTELDRAHAENRARMAPLYEEARKANGLPLTPPPELQSFPDYKPGPLVDPEKFKSFFSEAMVIALISAVATKRPLLGALNTLSGAMKGYHEGSILNANKKLQDFHEQLNSVVNKNNQILQKYGMIVRNQSMNLEQKMTAVRIAAAENGDEMTYRMASQRLTGQLFQHMYQISKLNAQLMKGAAGIKPPPQVLMYEHDAAWRQQHGQMPISPEQFYSGLGGTKAATAMSGWPATEAGGVATTPGAEGAATEWTFSEQ